MKDLDAILTDIPKDSCMARTVATGFRVIFEGAMPGEQAAPVAERVDKDSVRIGDQIWMSHNLKMPADPENGIYVSSGETYFTWDAAMKAASSCGNGWRLPAVADWNVLFSNFPGPKNGVRIAHLLRAADKWPKDFGDEKTGFDAYPMGWYSETPKTSDVNETHGVNRYGLEAVFWTSDEYGKKISPNQELRNAHCMITLAGDDDIGKAVFSKRYGLSVRLVKDA